MSMISELVDRLRVEAKSMGTYGTDYMATLLTRSADTIEMLSEKAREPKQVVMPKKCKGCDSASKIIEAYSRGFKDGANTIKQTFVADGIVFAKMAASNSSEKPNNCEECKHWNDTEDDCADRHGCRTTTEDWQDWKDKMWSEAVVTEPTTEDCSTVPTSSKMEQVDEPQTCSVNGRPYDCGNCEHFRCTADEPQTERPCDNCQEFDCYGCEYKQTERSE